MNNYTKTAVVVVGVGRIGKMHAEIIAAAPAARLVGVVDRSRKDADWMTRTAAAAPALAELAAAAVYASAEEAFADKAVDAVIIASSSPSHPELVLAAARAGKKILCEKPVAFSVSVLDALQRRLGDYRDIQVAFNRRFDPHFFALQRALARGDLGAVRSYHIVNRDPKRPPAAFVGGSGGMLADFNVHDFDMLRFLSGAEAGEIYVRGANLIDPTLAAHGDMDTVMISLRMNNGALANIDCTRETNYGYDQRIEVLGENGGLRAGGATQIAPVRLIDDGIVLPPLRESFISYYREAYVRQTDMFLAACRGERAFSPTLQDTRRAVAVVEAGNESLRQNKSVAVTY